MIDSAPPAPSRGCEAFYELRESPFAPEPNTSMVFASQSFQTTLDATITAIRANVPLVVLTGEAGLGKSLFYRWLTEGLTGQARLLPFDSPPADNDALLWELCNAMNAASGRTGAVPERTRAALRARCRDLMEQLAAADAAILVVLDNADTLAAETFDDLAELLSLGVTAANHLQVALIGGPPLQALLTPPVVSRFAQFEIKQLQLRPLGADEVGPYVHRRLDIALAPTARRIKFSEPAIISLATLSSGVPSAVNRLCDRALEAGHTQGTWDFGVGEVLAAARELGVPVPLGVRIQGSSGFLAGRRLLSIGGWGTRRS